MDPHCELPKMEKYMKMLFSKIYIPGFYHQIRCRIFLIMAALFVSGLASSYSFTENSVSGVLIAYVPSNWKDENLGAAAMVVSFLDGLSTILTFVVAHLCDAHIGRFRTVVWSTLLYILGLLMLQVSTSLPSLKTSLPIFLVAAVLISLGKAAKNPPLRGFFEDQISLHEQNWNMDNNQVRMEFKTTVWWRFACFVGAVSSLVYTIFGPAKFSKSCLNAAFLMGVAYVVFLSGIPFYIRKTPTGSPFTLIYKVFKVATLKWHLHIPQMISLFIKNNHIIGEIPLSSDTPMLSLDKAVVINVESSIPEEGKTSNQVMQINVLFKMIPMWTTFVVYSLVQTTGNTFFFSQSQDLNWDIRNNVQLSLSPLLIVKDFSSFAVSFMCELLISKLRLNEGEKQKKAALIRIGAGMACCLLCCITACLVEFRRLHLVDNLDYNQDETITLSIFWMFPQFILLGFMQGLAEDGLYDFLHYLLGQSMDIYGPPFNEIVLSICKFLSIPFILGFGSWIGDTVKDSHLDKYYLMLAILNIPNLCLNWYFCAIYAKAEDQEKENIVTDCMTFQLTHPHDSHTVT